MFQVGSSSELEVDIAILCFTCDRTVQYWPGCPEPFFVPPIITINSESRSLKFIFQALSRLTSKDEIAIRKEVGGPIRSPHLTVSIGFSVALQVTSNNRASNTCKYDLSRRCTCSKSGIAISLTDVRVPPAPP